MTKYLSPEAQAFESNTSALDASAITKLGTRARDTEGGEWIYLLGVASTTAGKFATWNESYATALLVADCAAPIGVAGAAIVASTYGWYQVWGLNVEASTDTVAGDTAAWVDGTAGRIDDAGSAGDWISGCWIRTADVSNVATVQLSYPGTYHSGYLT